MIDAYNLVKEALNPVPTENGVKFMAHWRFERKLKRPAREYMDLRFVNEAWLN